jgi:hypothetical protein
MRLTKVVVGITGAVFAIAGVTAVVASQGGDERSSKRPVPAGSAVTTTAVAPVSTGADPASDPASSAVTSPSSVPPSAEANNPVPVAGPAGVPGAAAVPTAQEVLDSVTALMNQLKQTASNNGGPQTITKEQVDAAIAEQLAKLGIKP